MRCEQRTTALSLLLSLLFHLPSPSPPESDRNRRTERQRRTASDRQIGVVSEKAMGEVIGENRVLFFSVSFLHLPIHHHVITARADHRACEGHFKDFLPS